MEHVLTLKSRTGAGLLLLTGYAALLMHCSPKTTRSVMPVDIPEAFSSSGSTRLPDKWWTAFGDEKLDTLVDQALDSNFSLRTVWYRVREAQAIADRESSFLFPDIEAAMEGGISRPEPDFSGGEDMQLALSAVYEVDLWGRIRARIDAEKYRAQAAMADYRSAAIALTGDIARTWYRLMAEWRQLALIEAQIETNEKMLSFIRAQFGSGQIRAVDILRQQQLVEDTRVQKILTESRIAVLEHLLSVLLGLPARRQMDYRPDSLPGLPPLPATGIPSTILQRRPDVRYAFKLLQAADREVAAAISSRYPRLSISTAVSLRANRVENLFREWAYSLAGNLIAPLFYGGRLNAEVDRTGAVKKQRLYEYVQAVLVALREVEDALVRERKQLETIEVLEEQVALAVQASQQLRIEYFNGMSDYLAVLTALGREQQLGRDLIAARLALLEFRIALYQALAGPFETRRAAETGG